MNAITRLAHRLRATLRSTAAAIDLASIMVGVIVIGIVAGVIVATVFAVIPWAQDEAAKADLRAFGDAQQVAYVADGDYDETAALVDHGYLPAQAATGPTSINSAVGTDCYVGSTTSASGHLFYVTSRGPGINPVLDTTDTNWCAPLPGEAWTLPDVHLRTYVLANLGLPADHQLTLEDAKNLTNLYLVDPRPGVAGYVEPGAILDAKGITDLSGLEQAANLEYLDLDWSGVSDLGPIAELANVEILHLNFTPVSNLAPIAPFTKVRELWLGYTSVADLGPMADWRNLVNLGIDNTGVSDLTPLENVATLDFLSAHGLTVTDWTPVEHVSTVAY